MTTLGLVWGSFQLETIESVTRTLSERSDCDLAVSNWKTAPQVDFPQHINHTCRLLVCNCRKNSRTWILYTLVKTESMQFGRFIHSFPSCQLDLQNWQQYCTKWSGVLSISMVYLLIYHQSPLRFYSYHNIRYTMSSIILLNQFD